MIPTPDGRTDPPICTAALRRFSICGAELINQAARRGHHTARHFHATACDTGAARHLPIHGLNAYDEVELVVCVTGDQVQPVWDLLTGVNNAYLRVDDGAQWELTYRLTWPGYGQQRNAC